MNNIRTNSNNSKQADFDKPQYNSTLKLINKLEQFQSNKTKEPIKLDERELEKINEKASTKLNMRGQVFGGLVSVEPDEEDFLKFLEINHKSLIKPIYKQSSSKTEYSGPDLMEFYPEDLIKEYPEIEVEPVKAPKIQTMKSSLTVTNNPINNYFEWN